MEEVDYGELNGRGEDIMLSTCLSVLHVQGNYLKAVSTWWKRSFIPYCIDLSTPQAGPSSLSICVDM